MNESKVDQRGGKREGAGRKPNFSFKEKLWIWNRYKRLRSRIERFNMKQRLAAEYNGTEIEELERSIHRFPASMRHKESGKTYRQIIVEYGEKFFLMSKNKESDPPLPPDEWSVQFPENLVDVIVDYRDYQMARYKRAQYSPRVRINGEAERIRAKIAQRATNAFGITVTAQDVKYVMDDRKREIRDVVQQEV